MRSTLYRRNKNSRKRCKISPPYMYMSWSVDSRILTFTEKYSCTFRLCHYLSFKSGNMLIFKYLKRKDGSLLPNQWQNAEKKCLVFSPKLQKLHTAEITTYTVYRNVLKIITWVQWNLPCKTTSPATQIWSFKTDGLSKETYSTYFMKGYDILKRSPKRGRYLIGEISQRRFVTFLSGLPKEGGISFERSLNEGLWYFKVVFQKEGGISFERSLNEGLWHVKVVSQKEGGISLERSLKEGLWHVKVVSQRRVISHWRGLLKKGYDMLKWSPTKRVVSHWRGLSKKACDILKWSPKRGRYLIGEVSQWRLVTC